MMKLWVALFLAVTSASAFAQSTIYKHVDANGRVQDYRILSDSKEAQEMLPAVKNMLIFTTFRPATSMGRPTPGRAVRTRRPPRA